MIKFARFSIFFALVSLGLGGSIRAQDKDYPPGTLVPMVDLELQTVDVNVPAKYSGQVPEGLTLNMPPGFAVGVFAIGNLRRPRLMAFDNDGVLFVGNMGRGQIVALPDRDRDGVADEEIVALEGLVEGHSLAFYKGDLYVGEEHQIIRARDNDGDLFYEEKTVFISDIPWEGWHDTRTIVFDEINEKLYVSVGSPCDLCRMDEGRQVVGNSSDLVPFSPERGTVLEFNADGTGRRVFATGVRNVIGMAFHPVTNELWGNNNGHDLEGRSRPPEWVDIMRDGDFMGYPLVQSHQVWNDFSINEYKKLLPITRQDSLLAATQKPPVALVPAHYAPMGIYFYTHDQFPDIYQNAALVAFRAGKAKLSSHPGYNVSAIFSEPDGSNARMGDFVTGFQTGTTQQSVWGFPVGLVTDSEGSLYISSNQTNHLILKITHSPVSGSWQHNLPDIIPLGSALDVDVTVRVERLAAAGGEPRLTADLSQLGGPEALPLEAVDETTYRLSTHLDLEDMVSGTYQLRVRIEQDIEGRLRAFDLFKIITLLPPEISGSWQHDLPDAVRLGSALNVGATVQVEQLAAGGGGLRLTADLSELGGPDALPLEAIDETTYRLDARLDLEGLSGGTYQLRVRLEQDFKGEVLVFELFKDIALLPPDLPILDDELAGGWRLAAEQDAQMLGPTADGPVFNGQTAMAVQGDPPNFFTLWSLELRPLSAVERFGFAGLRFVFHPGDVELPNVPILNLLVNGLSVDLVRLAHEFQIDLEQREWQVVEVPFEAFNFASAYRDGIRESVEVLESIRLEGNLNGTFYLDDMRLVTGIPAVPPGPTAVIEERDEILPDAFDLEQNYPNPFNSDTVIRFSLPQTGTMDLTVYNLVGQEVARLVYGLRQPGAYTVQWDGRDNADRKLATGAYVYRLRMGDRVTSRKLLLLR